jgi:hypothetical protein
MALIERFVRRVQDEETDLDRVLGTVLTPEVVDQAEASFAGFHRYWRWGNGELLTRDLLVGR